MALIADDAAHRVEQLLMLTERLSLLIAEETRRVEARIPPMEGVEADEKNRLVNAYRLELARIKHDRAMIDSAPAPLLATLRKRTVQLHEQLALHDTALGAVKLVSEGLVHAMAAEVTRQRAGALGYGAGGALDAPSGPNPAVLDRSA